MAQPLNLTEIVEIHWVDSCAREGWRDPERISTDLWVKSVGWLVFEDDDSVVITTSFDSSNVMDSLQIPKCSITGRWTIDLS